MDLAGLVANTVVVGIISNGWSRIFGDGSCSSAALETFFGGAFERLVSSLPGNKAYKEAVRTAQTAVNAALSRYHFDTRAREDIGRAISELLVPFLLEADNALAGSYDPSALASRAITSSPEVVQGLSTDQLQACQEVLSTALTAGLSTRDHLTYVEAKFRAAMLKGIGDLPAELRTFGLRLQAAALLEPRTPRRYHGRDFETAAALLDVRFECLELLGRDELLADFDAWRRRDGIGVRLVVGPGGIGKTRLGIELCRRAHSEGACAGFLASTAGHITTGVWQILLENSNPLLIIVDYADARIGDVQKLFEAIAAVHAPGGPQVRVVLIARTVGDWWEQRASWGGDGVPAFAISRAVQGAPIDLTAQPELPRYAIFDAAVSAFIRALGQGRKLEIQPPNLSVAAYRLPLFIRIAALHRVETALGGDSLSENDLMDSEDKLLDWTLERERRLNRIYGGFQEEYELEEVADVAAFVTLTGGCDEHDILAYLARVPSLSLLSGERRKRIAYWLAQLYPGPRFLNPMLPDRLGERLVGLRLSRYGNATSEENRLLSGAIGATAEEAERVHALILLNRLADWMPDEVGWLIRALTDYTSECAKPALTVAIQMPQPIGPVMEQIFRERPLPHIAIKVVYSLPARSVMLRRLALIVTQQAIDFLKNIDSEDKNLINIELGVLNSNYSTRLRDIGDLKAALHAAQMAVESYRMLHAKDPRTPENALPMTLMNYATCLAEVGRRKEGLEAIEESVKYYRQLAASSPIKYTAPLAVVLSNLAASYSELEKFDQAVEASRAAVQAWELFFEYDSAVASKNIGGALMNLAKCLADFNRLGEALICVRRAEEYIRREYNNSSDAFSEEMAVVLEAQATIFSTCSLHQEALSAITEAVSIYRRLNEILPSAFGVSFARSLINKSNKAGILGNLDDAVGACIEAISIQRQLPRENINLLISDLASSFLALSIWECQRGHDEIALRFAKKAVAIRRKLASDLGDHHLSDLARALYNMAGPLSNIGDWGGGCKILSEVVSIRRKQTMMWPEVYRKDLAYALASYANFLSMIHWHLDARIAARESIKIREILAQNNPVAFRNLLAHSYGVLATVERRIGYIGGAFKLVEVAIFYLYPDFIRCPTVHANLMRWLIGIYLEAAKSSGARILRMVMRQVTRSIKVIERHGDKENSAYDIKDSAGIIGKPKMHRVCYHYKVSRKLLQKIIEIY